MLLAPPESTRPLSRGHRPRCSVSWIIWERMPPVPGFAVGPTGEAGPGFAQSPSGRTAAAGSSPWLRAKAHFPGCSAAPGTR